MRFLIIFSLFLFHQIAFSENLYDFKIIEVIDGDTLVIEAPYLPAPLKPELKLRIMNVDTPEKGHRAQCESEKNQAAKAKEFVEQKINNGIDKKIRLDSWDKYGGRVLGDVIIDGQSLGDLLIQSNFAKSYQGGKKISWCP